MYRTCSVYNPDENASKPLLYKYIVSEENSEPWSEGVTVFHNPNAKNPLPLNYFKNATQCCMNDDNMIVTYNTGCTVFSSITLNFTNIDDLHNYEDSI